MNKFNSFCLLPYSSYCCSICFNYHLLDVEEIMKIVYFFWQIKKKNFIIIFRSGEIENVPLRMPRYNKKIFSPIKIQIYYFPFQYFLTFTETYDLLALDTHGGCENIFFFCFSKIYAINK